MVYSGTIGVEQKIVYIRGSDTNWIEYDMSLHVYYPESRRNTSKNDIMGRLYYKTSKQLVSLVVQVPSAV